MAKRRMISKDLIKSTDFIMLTPKAKLLYFLLNSDCDDDGFTSPYITMNLHHIEKEFLIELTRKKFIHTFIKIINDEGQEIRVLVKDLSNIEMLNNIDLSKIYVVVLSHWHESNKIRKDIYKPSIYEEEMKQLEVNNKGHIVIGTGEYRSYYNIKLANNNEPISIEQVKKEYREKEKNIFLLESENFENEEYTILKSSEYDEYILNENMLYGSFKNIYLKDSEYDYLYRNVYKTRLSNGKKYRRTGKITRKISR